MSKTYERRDWTDWQPGRLRLDEDMGIPRRTASMYEELGLIAALVALAIVILFLI